MSTFQPPLLGLEVSPTIAMRRGEQAVFQCSECGSVVVQSSLANGALGPCPACRRDCGWWRQQLPVAGLRERKGAAAS
jgi:hypothetical protein